LGITSARKIDGFDIWGCFLSDTKYTYYIPKKEELINEVQKAIQKFNEEEE